MKILVLTFLLAVNASAATYYIDYASGSDSNSGLSKSTPWQRHPYMAKFVGSYKHQAGDQFIFKGGVTWPNSCFTMQLMAGGVSGSPDYYGVDPSWYVGSSWTRPKWDAGGVELPGGYDVMVLFSISTRPSYVTLDNLDLTGLYWSGNKSYSWVAFINLSYSSNVTIQNCYIHNWTHAPMPTADQLKVVIGANSSPFNPGCVIKNTIIDGENAANRTQGQSSGEATYAYSGNVINCTIRNLASGPIVTGDPNSSTPQVVSGCNIGPCYMSYDSGAHPDGLFMNGGRVFWWHDNYIHDCYVMSIFTGEGSGNEDTYVWNNVIYNVKMAPPIVVDNFYSGARMWFWNNTLVGGSFAGVRVVNRNKGPLGVLDYRNNLVISDSALVTMDSGATISGYTNRNNVLLTTAQAAAAGYSVANLFQPTAATSPTVGVGADLSGVLSGALLKDILGNSRPQGQGWDVGAYELSSTTPVTPVTPPTPPPPSNDTTLAGFSWGATQGTLTSPMVIASSFTGSYMYAPVDATTLYNGGLASYTFSISTAGSYYVSAVVSTADQAHNSVWVTIDQAMPDDPLTVWDMPVTSSTSWQKCYASWRGTGSNTSPQYPQKSWSLGVGTHTLYIRGRESDTRIQTVSVEKVPTSPSNLRIVSAQQ